MSTIRIRRTLDSDTLHLPELRPLIGKAVEITVTETPAEPAKDWSALEAIAGTDVIDPEVYKQYREFDRQHNKPPEL
ncbi:MAG TPA: hypothetical protein VGF55_27865 [Gemmataceae bacterium]|jgi:hypothetical protein